MDDASGQGRALARSGREIVEATAAARRRVGLAMVAAVVALVALQGSTEWLLPYDPLALQDLRVLLRWPHLDARRLAWGWSAACLAALGLLALAGRRYRPAWTIAAASAAGAGIGSARVAGGGAMTALLLLLVAGVATLGWQSRREGGAALLAAAAVSIVAWEALLSSAPTSWPVCIGLVGLFVFIEQRHVQAGNRRLASALDERERLIADLDANRAALTQLQAARTRLLASISHDLCQPLQAIRLYAEAMRLRVADAGLDELLRHQLRAADDAVDMVEQFGDFSAIEQGSLRSRSEPVDLREVIHRVADGLRATRAQPAVRVGEHGRMQWVSSDRSQITRIVQNLAANALRHARAAHADTGARVVLACREHHGDLAIEVIDNGQGIPADKLEAIFEPYVQLGGTGASRGGRGLGLAIARGLAQQLGLRFAQVRSLPGRGAWFRVIVPAAMRIAAPGPAEKQPEARSQWSGRMIAVLDDEDAPRLALAAALRAAGAYCIEAAEFTALRRLLDAELRFPDALLFDLDLHAEIDGVGAVRLLREAWELDVPAVIVTGRVDARGAISLPDRCVLLAKPVGLGDIDAALRRTAPQDDRGLIA